jgi:hypothetical protein
MSADNGIYILKTKDGQFRVNEFSAVENLWWSFEKFDSVKEMVPTRILERYGHLRYTRDFEKAMKVANAIKKKCYILEYGIQILETNKTWNQIVREAKQLAPKEIESIKKHGGNWEWDIKQLEKIISA